MNIKNLVLKTNVTKFIKDIKSSLIEDCLSQRNKINSIKDALNYPVESKYTNFLYNIFYLTSKKYLKNFDLSDVNFKLWCYLTDEKYNKGIWHNHSKTSSINCVIYLKTQGKGIHFKHNNEEIYILPNDNDMLIFPGFLDHLPEQSKKEPRITLNLELRCKEPTEKIFNL
tara:strand:+ start:53 stop:562 length:510 start_codon:yes stop_codon:yes gene_type:complete